MVKKIIYILSNQFYDVNYHTNKHYIAKELDKKNILTLFINPPTRIKGLKHILKTKSIFIKKTKNLYVYTPINFLNLFPFNILNNLFHKLVIYIFFELKIESKNKYKKILWVYHFDFPGLDYFKKLINYNISIYDCVDSYPDFPQFKDRKQEVIKIEKALAKESNIIFTSHPMLFKRFIKINKNTYYTPNASNYKEYSIKPKNNLKVFNKIKSPKILYSGALDSYKFDITNFLYLAKQLPKVNFCLVGDINVTHKDEKMEQLKNLKNIHLIGQLKQAEKYAHFFNAYIIPYVYSKNNYNGCRPIKFFNALSTGVPIITTDLPCYFKVKHEGKTINKSYEDLIYIAKYNNVNYDNIPEEIKLPTKKQKDNFKKDLVKQTLLAIKEDELKKRNLRKKEAQKYTWSDKVNQQIDAINKVKG